ncbi:MAG TPA: hypothetical protein VFC05_12790, partial [Nitrososphaeraceae archaeon]|nr:hypothetical protein [Nitrososphaeraceae archaeon]
YFRKYQLARKDSKAIPNKSNKWDGQRRGSFGREIGVVYCDGKNLNEQLMENNLGIIDRRFCEKSEFSDDKWVKPFC